MSWKSRFLVLDTETTGLKADDNRIVELGLVLFEDAKVVETANYLINPGMPIPPGASKIHGITDEEVANAHTFAQAFAEVHDMFDGVPVVAYNAPFDRRFFLHELRGLGPKCKLSKAVDRILKNQWIDPLVWARTLLRDGYKNHKLATVCRNLSIPLGNAHQATADAEATGDVLLALERLNQMPADFTELIEKQARLNAVITQGRFAKWAKWRSSRKDMRPGEDVKIHQCDVCGDMSPGMKGKGGKWKLPDGWATFKKYFNTCSVGCELILCWQNGQQNAERPVHANL